MQMKPGVNSETSNPRPRSESDLQVLQRLRQSCRRALERYVDAASHSSGQLMRVSSGGVDQLGRINLARLRQTEQQAHESYLEAREALLEFVLAGSQPVASTIQ